ncbi:sialate O-acetylesterase [Microbacter margulisiae]|uniref:Sialate O-acetylesterase n=2 Tax=Microbacter margulisiae TaxID=1350067 RepID=A0A7W5DQC1_9PORP|nr:sialate O-acetylesterase [Microbacter margulisiae]
MNKISFILLFSAISICLHAELRLPKIFSDNMVLQQQTNVSIWGWAKANSIVHVTPSWDKKHYEATADRTGKWKLAIATPKAGNTPYELTIKDGEAITLKNILIGEVWLCSGQSNMEMPMKGFKNTPVLHGNIDILTSQNPEIRLITIKRNAQIKPVDDITGSWQEANPVTVSKFSATAYYFGRMLNKILGIPVGLICSSWGGSPIQSWMSSSMLNNFHDIRIPHQGDTIKVPNRTPTLLFNGMINPIIGFSIKGCIWYQGENNYLNPDEYPALFETMVSNWRKLWNEGTFPFYFCQIAPFDYASITPASEQTTKTNSAYLREAQYKAAQIIPNSGMAVLMDIGEKDCIHPEKKEVGAERLALLALAKTYGLQGFDYESPTFYSMSIVDNKATISFDHAPMWLTSFGKELKDFEIAGKDKVFYPAKAEIKRSKVVVWSPQVPEPVAVRYAFKDFIVGDLFSTGGLPVSSFRTDNW